MRHAQAWLAALGLTLSGLVACAAMDAEAGFSDKNGGSKSPGVDDDGGDDGTGNGSSSSGAQGAPTSNGVLVVNAARAGAFRLCFSEHPDWAPQPDAKVMPQANVVGVDIGSVVRIDPIKNPGKIYVVREEAVRSRPGEKTKSCGEWIKKDKNGADTGLPQGISYFVAKTPITEDVGEKQAVVLAISGCASQGILASVDGVDITAVNGKSCGADWNATIGNLEAHVVPLVTTNDKPGDQTIPISLYNMAPAVEVLEGSLTVSFGEEDGGVTALKLNGPFEEGAPAVLNVNQTQPASYGQQGFTVTTTINADKSTIVQTLADVQAFSAPGDTPTRYYYSASNYALLLLGDPAHKPVDGGVYNPSRGLHLLAVPVLDPNQVDAGTDSGPSDAGDAGVP